MKKEEAELNAKVAACCRILYVEGHDDANLGHVSARRLQEPVFNMKPQGLGLEEVRPEDLLTLDLDGRVLAGNHQAHNEYPIHAEIYRARPDVNCVIHTHPLYSITFSTLGASFQVLNHDGVWFYREGLPLFDETADLLVTREQGESLARTLGDACAVLLRNHGTVVVGRTVEEACLIQLALERSVRILVLALASGRKLSSMDPATAGKMSEDLRKNERRTANIFNYYERKSSRVLAAGF